MHDRYNWEANPKATHCEEGGWCFYFKDEDGIWQLLHDNGYYEKSESLYNGDWKESDLIAKENV